jgi:hypothetical protein
MLWRSGCEDVACRVVMCLASPAVGLGRQSQRAKGHLEGKGRLKRRLRLAVEVDAEGLEVCRRRELGICVAGRLLEQR